eukprot:Skav227640  [mRNA]  locus=scaffold58:167510:174958:+ [translate_table: standard]
MGDQASPERLTSCTCGACLSFWRVATLVRRHHHENKFLEQATKLLRHCNSELQDFIEQHLGGSSLAGGGHPTTKGAEGKAGKHEDPVAVREKLKDRLPAVAAASEAKKERESRSRTRRRRRRSRRESEGEVRTKRHSRKRSRRSPSRSATSGKKEKAPEEKRSEEPKSSKKGVPPEEDREDKRSVKEEDEEEPSCEEASEEESLEVEEKKESRGEKEGRGTRSPAPVPSSSRKKRSPSASRGHSGGREAQEKKEDKRSSSPPPGDWVLRPRSPLHPPPLRVRAPPPQQWSGDSGYHRWWGNQWRQPKNKGKERVRRQKDIVQHGPSQRPAARVRGLAAPAVEVPVVEQYKRGDLIIAKDLPLGEFKRGDWLVCEGATYFQNPIQVAFKVDREELGEERVVVGELTGTSSEALLKYGSGISPPVLRAHVCGDECDKKRENPNYIHLDKIKKIREAGDEGWITNLIPEAEVTGLQEEHAQWRRKQEERGREKTKRSRSSSSSQKKKKKKKRKDEPEAVGAKEAPVKSARLGGRTVAKKELSALFSGTGMDPDAGRRKKLARHVKKNLRKGKDSSGDSSSSSSSSGSSMANTEELLTDKSKNPTNQPTGSRFADKPHVAADETPCGTTDHIGVGARREEPSPDNGGLQQVLPGSTAVRGSGKGSHHLVLRGRPPHPRTGERVPGCTRSTSKEHRGSIARHTMANLAAAGTGASPRTSAGVPWRIPGRKKGKPFGCQGPRKDWRRREGERQRKREGQRKRKGQRQSEDQGGRGEEVRMEKADLPKEGEEKKEAGKKRKRKSELRTLPESEEREWEKAKKKEEEQGREKKRSEEQHVHEAIAFLEEQLNEKDRREASNVQKRGEGIHRPRKDDQEATQQKASKQGVQKRQRTAFSLGRKSRKVDTHLPAAQSFPVGAAATAPTVSSGSLGSKDSGDAAVISPGLGRAERKKEGDAVSHISFICKTAMTTGTVSDPAGLCRTILRMLVLSLNSLNGEGGDCDEKCTGFQRTVLENLMEDCVKVSQWEISESLPSWDQFFSVRGIDYKGEEVLTAQSMQWCNVSPALPQEVGGVALADVVDKGCREYVLNFEEYHLPEEDQVKVKPPRVMVASEHWTEFCDNLLKRGVFQRVHEDDLPYVQDQPLLNGLFGVSKNEFQDGWEVMRIIMNLIPLNGICRSFEGDVATLPSWAGMTPLCLRPHEELLISSEDVRCFFYIFRVPTSWHRYLAFNRPLPPELCGDKPGKWYPCSAVLPMGFKNSVSLAQNVHRFIVKNTLTKLGHPGGEAELRKDRPFPSSNPVHRIYLDNFDQLEKTNGPLAESLKGTLSPLILGLREEYSQMKVPRHPKKAVARQTRAEVQGAIVDGVNGTASPKVEKIVKYIHLARLLVESGVSSQRQMQVIGGGFVYIALFRRPLQSGLNHMWEFIMECNKSPPVVKFAIPENVKEEILRFIGLVPLAYMDFRNEISQHVTASDASEFGGGVTVSTGLTPAGAIASHCKIRGDIVEPVDLTTVLTIGLFDGIGALRMAADVLGWCVTGHISVEKSTEASRVVESRFAGSIIVPDVCLIDDEMVARWASQFTQVSLVVIGGGPPCQGVSGLNAARKGALKDERSCLFVHVARVRELVKKHFKWAQVRSLMESVASMDLVDQDHMSASFGEEPVYIDAGHVSLAHRPRLYWVDWELKESPDVEFSVTSVGRTAAQLKAIVAPEQFLLPGWTKVSDRKFPTFTPSRPRAGKGYKPAGLKQCQRHEVQRWVEDSHRFPPYQYQDVHCLKNRAGRLRLPSIEERETIVGMPRNYTMNCMPKKDQGSEAHLDCRLSLVGNSWNVTVIAWLLSQLGTILGVNEPLSVQDIVQRTTPGTSESPQSFLQRPSMQQHRKPRKPPRDRHLVQKLLTLVSMKGEDILLQNAGEDQVRYRRLRASIPANLWRWKTAASWRWQGNREHINVLEMCAVLTALKWRLERHQRTKQKFVHLVDSLVVLRSLSRGRSSSRKLRRTVLRIGALLLATKSQAVWAYVHTELNPADAPSRRLLKRKWSKCPKDS